MDKLEGTTPGALLLFGSGETLPASGKAYDYLADKYEAPLKIAVLETPAGFQPNTQRVAENVGDYLKKRLQNFRPQVQIIPARKRGTDFSPDDGAILEPMLASDWVFMGPGSPTYAVEQLQGSLAYDTLRALHLCGSAVCLASAAVLAISAWTLPIYEIYKVGQEPFWMKGLDFLSDFGLNVTFIPHWNNHDGGEELDTSRCFMGRERFAGLRTELEKLDENTCLVGIDEQTALLMEFMEESTCRVFGKGSVTIMRINEEAVFNHGHTFPLSFLGNYRQAGTAIHIQQEIWDAIETAQTTQNEPPEGAKALAVQREEARKDADWPLSDRLRAQIEAQGWQVLDTPNGPQLMQLP